METSPSSVSSSSRRLPLWLLSASAILALLAIYALATSFSASQPGPSEFDEAQFDGQIDAAIDAELSEFLGMPELMPSPDRSPWETVYSPLTIELPSGSGCDWEFPQPTPRNQFDPSGGRYWEWTERGSKSRLVSTGYSISEAAVAAALEWLTLHQQTDGGWSFSHRAKSCDENCTHLGTLAECRTGATALALLPYLGAGQTHKSGKYKKQVEAGLYFLCEQLKLTVKEGRQYGDLTQGGECIYAQALSTLVLCEAYGLSRDKGLRPVAQMALNQLLRDPAVLDDGWRWMALCSGRLAELEVDRSELARGNQLLAGALADRNQYQLIAALRRQKTISVGILSQLYAGSPTDNPLIERGIKLLDQWGPTSGDLDYRYFATQSMRNASSERWSKWHASLRDQLVNSQEQNGHARGSWHRPDDDGAATGGRLYCTAMAAAILEVYYRHLPVYGQVSPK